MNAEAKVKETLPSYTRHTGQGTLVNYLCHCQPGRGQLHRREPLQQMKRKVRNKFIPTYSINPAVSDHFTSAHVQSFADIVSGGCTSTISVSKSQVHIGHGCTLQPEITSSTRPTFTAPLALKTAPHSMCGIDVVNLTQSTHSGFRKVLEKRSPSHHIAPP